MRASLLFLLALSIQVSRDLVFEVETWPGEGRPVFEAVARELSLHERPSGASKILRRITVSTGQRFTFDGTLYRTIKPGRFTALAAGQITGRRLGNINALSKSDYYSGKFSPVTLPVQAGDTVEYLQYRAEGTCFIRIASDVIDAKLCPNQQPSRFRLDTEPITEWWIHVTIKGKPAGWLLVSDAVVKVVDRLG